MHTSAVTGLAAVMLVVAGCSGSDDAGLDPGETEPADTTTAAADPFDEGAVAAEPIAALADDDECDVPITFDIADAWTAESVLADLDFEQGGLMPVCEIDAKPAGWLGYIRVWSGPAEDAEQALEEFLADGAGEVEEPESRQIEIAGVDGVETAYVRFLPAVDERKRERAFAVSTGDEVAVVTVSGFDTEEYEGMLPAYILARETAQLLADGAE
ncbi:lipoprotein [Phytoactinopolyspora endophytica]|uniref:lipoprotein n=1 Tax=Phytoactinopolyspora endophytica TaxID=1642495 RepID=UPI00101BC497|nr:lipoprotein [Phytoactinopolyspora endophytica]